MLSVMKLQIIDKNMTQESGQTRASFVEFRTSEKREAKSVQGATSQLGRQSILTPIFLGNNTQKKIILLFYERLHCVLDD